LIVVALIAGLLVAWQVYFEPYRRQRETFKFLEELGGSYKTEPSGRTWHGVLFGDGDGKFHNIIEINLSKTTVTNADLAHLKGLTNLRWRTVY